MFPACSIVAAQSRKTAPLAQREPESILSTRIQRLYRILHVPMAAVYRCGKWRWVFEVCDQGADSIFYGIGKRLRALSHYSGPMDSPDTL